MEISTKCWGNFLILAIILRCGNTQNSELCNQCLDNGVACLDQVRFATCYKGALTDNIVRCPANKICTTDTLICLELTPGIEPVCFENKCGTCEYTNGRFACLDETTYAFCYGSMEPNLASVRVCPQDLVCDYNTPQICASKEVATPSCIPSNGTPATEDPSTTTTAMEASLSTEDPYTTTTMEASLTTEDPSTTTMEASLSTEDPSTTTMEASLTTGDPSTITMEASLTTEDPSTTTMEASLTTEDPSTTTVDTSLSTAVTTTTDSVTTESTTDSTTTDVVDSSTTATTTDSSTTGGSDTIATSTESTITDVSDTTIPVSNSDATSTTTVETTPIDPSTFCANMQNTGYFRAAGDITCKEYIYCYLLAGQYLGQKYTCAGYFNAEVGKCQNEKPANC